MSKMLKLETTCGRIFEISHAAVRHMITIQTMLDFTESEKDFNESIKLADVVKWYALRRIIAWCEHYKDHSPESVDDDKEICFPQPDDLNLVHYVIKPIPQFDAEVMDMPLGNLIDVIDAADFLDARGAMSAATRTYAKLYLKEQTGKELKKLYNVKRDTSSKEVKEARKIENKMAPMGVIDWSKTAYARHGENDKPITLEQIAALGKRVKRDPTKLFCYEVNGLEAIVANLSLSEQPANPGQLAIEANPCQLETAVKPDHSGIATNQGQLTTAANPNPPRVKRQYNRKKKEAPNDANALEAPDLSGTIANPNLPRVKRQYNKKKEYRR